MNWTKMRKISALATVVGVVGLVAALTGATVLAWSRGDFSSTTQTYTSATVPSDGSYGSVSASATAGQYLTDSETVTVTGFDYLPASQYQFALYPGTPGESCPALTGGPLPHGYVFESGVISEPNTSHDDAGYLNNTQSARESFSATVNSSQATSDGYYQVPANALGAYFWIARYYDQADQITLFSPCEPLTVSGPPPAIPTVVATTASAGGYAPTTSVSDLATVSAQSGTGVPAGNVTFNLYGPSASPVCGEDLVFGPRTVALSEAGTATSPSFAPTAVGTYYWTASYSPGAGSGFAPSASACGASGESVTILAIPPGPPPQTPNTPTVTTIPSSGGPVGTALSDTAHVTGIVNPAGADTVSFGLYSDALCSTLVVNLGSGSLLAVVPGNGVPTWAASSPGPGYAPPVAATYYWGVTFNAVGDPANLSSSLVCGEPVTITPSSGTQPAHTTTPAGAVKAASTPAPNTGAALFLPGLLGALALIFGGLLVMTGVRIRRNPGL